MLKVQRQALKKMKKKFDGVKFDWKKLSEKKEKVLEGRRVEIKERKQEIVNAAKKRLNKKKDGK